MAEKKTNIRLLSPQDIELYFKEIGEKKYRCNQVSRWLWKNFVSHVDQMTNISLNVREQINKDFVLHNLKIDKQYISADGTIKLRLETFDGHKLESVLIPTKSRLTGCISSQVGCSLDCSFCSTGRIKLKRQLYYDEIYNQVVLLNNICMEKYGKRISNLVYMGMGEPLLNYGHVKKSIEYLTNADYFNISPKRITVSTSGISKMIKKIADDKLKCELALSLHATNNDTRTKIMSINESNPIEDLLDSLKEYYQKTNNKITLEYVLLANINDSIADAERLISIYKESNARVINIIEYNPTGIDQFKKPSKVRFETFVNHIKNRNINIRIRKSRGDDIAAACGQLANAV